MTAINEAARLNLDCACTALLGLWSVAGSTASSLHFTAAGVTPSQPARGVLNAHTCATDFDRHCPDTAQRRERARRPDDCVPAARRKTVRRLRSDHLSGPQPCARTAGRADREIW